MCEEHYRSLALCLGVTESHYKAGHAFAAVGVVTTLHFPSAIGAGVIVNGDIGSVCPGIYTNLFFLHGLACGKAAGGHLRLFHDAVPEFLHMAQANAYS